LRLLCTNDDGILAFGLACLIEAAEPLGEITVVAPDREQSATSHSLTLHHPVRPIERGERRFQVDGTPTDCVMLAVEALMPERPDFVLSGINHGQNMGEDVLYSGTVAAAMEGFLFGIPAIAFSQVQKGWVELDAASRVARSVIEQVLREPPAASHYLLNVNIPNRADADTLPRRITRLGRRHASEPVIRHVSPRGETLFWIGPAGDAREAGPGTDFHATSNGEVSITPLHVDLTDHATLPAWRLWAERVAG
jgi:5'-nucleotidase